MYAGTSHQPLHTPADLITRGSIYNTADFIAHSSHPLILSVPQQQKIPHDWFRMPPKNQVTRRSSATPRLEGQPSRRANPSQLITFVNSQDPNSRSAIQRHTAHHSNAQRRDARLRSLRSNRPRLLEWQRRLSTDTDLTSNTSPQDSTASNSPSPAPSLRVNLSAPGSISTEVTRINTVASRISPPVQEADQSTDEPLPTDELVQSFLDHLCPLADRDEFQNIMNYIKHGDICSRTLLLALICLRTVSPSSNDQKEIDNGEAQRLYGKGTRLLHDRLTNPETASSDANIQAVLLLVAYASDTASENEVHIHTEALSRMISHRGGLSALESEINPALLMQITAISSSRDHHLTLGCRTDCLSKSRFPNNPDLLGLETL